MKLKTEFTFILPQLYRDKKIKGVMRLVKVNDLIEVHRDTRVKENPSYFYIVLLTRVITAFTEEKMITTHLVENLSTQNFAFLIDFLNKINHNLIKRVPVECKSCNLKYDGELKLVGEY